jgi:hypothetical protein
MLIIFIFFKKVDCWLVAREADERASLLAAHDMVMPRTIDIDRSVVFHLPLTVIARSELLASGHAFRKRSVRTACEQPWISTHDGYSDLTSSSSGGVCACQARLAGDRQQQPGSRGHGGQRQRKSSCCMFRLQGVFLLGLKG